MKRTSALALTIVLVMSLLLNGCADKPPAESKAPAAPSSAPSQSEKVPDEGYPAGKMTFWTYGMPEYMRRYFDGYAKRENSGAQSVEVEMVNYSAPPICLSSASWVCP